MAVKIEVNPADVRDVKLALAGIKNGAARALSTGINKTIKTTQVQAVKLIGRDLNLKAARIKEDFYQDRASYTRPTGALIASGEPVGLINFAAKQVNAGVKVKVKKTGPRSLIKHAYIGGSKSGKHIFRRKRDNMPAAKKFPVGKKSSAAWSKMGGKYRGITRGRATEIERLTGPRIEDIYGSPEIYSKVQKIAAEALIKNIGAEVESLIRRFG